MRFAFYFIAVLILVIVALFSSYLNGGMVSIVVADNLIEVSLTFVILSIIALLFIIHLFFYLLSKFINIPNLLRFKWQEYSKEVIHESLEKGLLALEKNEFSKAGKYLAKLLKAKNINLIYYVLIAKAAGKANNYDKVSEILNLALSKYTNESELIRLTEARILKNLDTNAAIHVLELLIKNSFKSGAVFKELFQIANEADNYEVLARYLDSFKPHIAYGDYLSTMKKLTLYNLNKDLNLSEINAIWKSTNNFIKKDKEVILKYAKKLLSFKKLEEASGLLEKSLKQSYQQDFVFLYGLIDYENHKRVKFLKSLLEDNPNDYFLLFSMGNLMLYLNLYGEAKTYYHQALNVLELDVFKKDFFTSDDAKMQTKHLDLKLQLLANLSQTYQNLNLPNEANKLYQKILSQKITT